MKLTNYFEHPADTRYMVYRYREQAHADRFEERIKEASIPYEKHLDAEEGVDWIYFGIEKTYMKAANRANHLTVGEFRSNFIPHRGFRWGVVIFGVLLVIIAIVSALMQAS